MNVLKLSFLSFFLLVSTSVFSQNSPFRFGVNAGVNMSNAMLDNVDTNGSSFRVGYQIGLTVDYTISQRFNILSGVYFITKGSKIEDLDYTNYTCGTPDFTHKFEQQYLQLPLYGAYKFNLSDDLNLGFGIGPYFAYGIGGKSKETLNNSVWGDGTSEHEYKTFGKNEEYLYYQELKRFDFGLGALVNLEYKKFNLDISCDQGFLDIARNTRYEHRNYSLTFSIGYKY
ncbi:MAG: PorT family protein [Tannerellaceae bacterium]|nr:PorT family protein [Tannerellaceae bacterium]